MGASSLDLAVRMNYTGTVHPPFHDVGFGGLESQREFQVAPEVVDDSDELLPVILIRCHNLCGEESNSSVYVRASTLSGKNCLSNICMKSLRPFFIHNLYLFVDFE